MKYEIEIKVGDVVKSLDFVGHDDCYQVDKRFKSDTFVAPLPGHHFADDLMFPRVQVVA